MQAHSKTPSVSKAAMTIGAALGRIEAKLLHSGGFVTEENVGRYALVGAAAALGGVTRMTVTIAVILAEVTDDVEVVPVCMLALAVARALVEGEGGPRERPREAEERPLAGVGLCAWQPSV